MAYQKVMIAGMDTAALTVLTEAEKMALLREMQETGSEKAREKLILGNLRLVLSVIQRFTGRGEDADDLFQIGVIGLMKAINNFDLTKDVRFSTYCVPMIAGELRRHLRDHHAVRVSRSLRDLAYKAMQAREKLTAAQADAGKLTEAQSALADLQAKYAADSQAWESQRKAQAYEFAVRTKAGELKFSSNAARNDFIRSAVGKQMQLGQGKVPLRQDLHHFAADGAGGAENGNGVFFHDGFLLVRD